jgi:Right handed beta helix region
MRDTDGRSQIVSSPHSERGRSPLANAMSMCAAVAFVGVSLAAARAQATEYFVAPTGSDTNLGTMASPFATLQKGNDVAAAGDTVWLRAGTYFSTRQIVLSRSGTSNTNRTKFWAYQNEVPILDCSRYVSTNKGADVPAVLVTGNWVHLRGLEIANGPVGASGDHSISMLRTRNSSNNTFELLNIHHGFGPGLFIDTGTGGNLILNCDSHDNYDKNGSQGDGQNGDGFGVHYQTTGPSTIIRGCRAWINSDDGYDLISQEVPVTVENSWAIQNGFANGGSVSPVDGNGNGFKMGSSLTGIRHIVQNNVAWKNKAAGFYANHSSGGNTWLNNTSYMNGTQYNMLASPPGDSTATLILTGALAHKMRNNIGFPNRNTNMGGVDTMFNTWDLNITETAADFASTSDTGATGPRQADGSMPAVDFLKLKAGSPLIDKGTNVGLPFVATAPDLGAYEFGAVTTPGTGGSSGGGGSGAGGSNGGRGGSGAGGSAGLGGVSGTGGVGGARPGSGGSVTTGSGGASAGSGGAAGEPTGAGETSGGCACVLSAGGPASNRVGLAGVLGFVLAFAGIAGSRRRKRPHRS